MPRRFRQVLLIVSMLWLSWLAMMLVHEGGHVIGALCTGGRVERVVWHPGVMSRTDVRPNPHPLVEAWAGPVIGSLIPLMLAGIASVTRRSFAYLIWVCAGFCLIANGAYIGTGVFHAVGDAKQLLAHGMSRWTLAGFGAVAVFWGFWIWDRVSPKLGLGSAPQPIDGMHAYVALALAVLVTAVGVIFGDRGF